MSQRDDIYNAIRAADAAGDGESVKKLGAYLQTLPADDGAPALHTYQVTKAGKPIQFQLPETASDEEVRAAAVKAAGPNYARAAVDRGGKVSRAPNSALWTGASHAAEGYTAGLLNPVAAAFDTIIPGVGQIDNPDVHSAWGGSKSFGDTFRDNLNVLNSQGESDAAASPGSALTGTVSGALLSPLNKLAAPVKGVGILTNAVRAGTGASIYGLIHGAASNIQNGGKAMASSAASEGATDAALGAALGAGAPLVARGVRGSVGAVRRTLTGDPGNTAIDLIAERLAADNVTPADAASALTDAHGTGTPNVLADLGDNVRELGGSITRQPGAARTIGRSVTLARQVGSVDQLSQGERLRDAMGRDLAPLGNTPMEAMAAQDAARSAADAAHVQAGDILDRAVSQIGPTTDRIATGQSAREAYGTAYAAAKQRTSEAYQHPDLMDNPPVALRPVDPYDVRLPDGPSSPPIDGFQQEVTQAVRGTGPAAPRGILSGLRSRGIDPTGFESEVGNLKAAGMDSRGAPSLFRKGGANLEHVLESAKRDGNLPPEAGMDDLVNALADEHNGRAVYHAADDLAAAEAHRSAVDNGNYWDRALDGRDPLKMTDQEWRSFHNEMSGKPPPSDTATLNDLEGMPSQGRLMGPFQHTIMGLRDQFFGAGGAEAPAYTRGFFDKVLNAPDVVGLRTIEDWEKQAYDLAAKAPDQSQRAFLQTIGKAIGAKASNEAGPARRAALDAARAARREQGRVFETRDLPQTFGKDQFGEPKLGDTSIPGRILRTGAAGGDTADSLVTAVGRDQAEGLVRQEMRRVVEAAGTLTPAKARTIAANYKDALDRFPNLRTQIADLATHAENLQQAGAEVGRAGRPGSTMIERGGASINKTAQQIERDMIGLSPDEQRLWARGFVNALADKVSASPDGAEKVKLLVGSGKKREILQQVFGGSANLDRFMRTLENEHAAAKTYAAVHGGPATAGRIGEDAANAGLGLAQTAVDVAKAGRHGATGILNYAAGRAIGRVGDAFKYGAGQAGQRARENVASLLFSSDPSEFRDALDSANVKRLISANRLNRVQAGAANLGGRSANLISANRR